MTGNNKSSKLKTKNKSTLPLTPKSTSSTPTTIRHQLSDNHQTKKAPPNPPNIIGKFITHRFREYVFAKKKDILRITNTKKANVHVCLTKYGSDLLHETNTYVSENANGKVKFYFCRFVWKSENQIFL